MVRRKKQKSARRRELRRVNDQNTKDKDCGPKQVSDSGTAPALANDRDASSKQYNRSANHQSSGKNSDRVIAAFTGVLTVFTFFQTVGFFQTNGAIVTMSDISWAGQNTIAPNRNVAIGASFKNSGQFQAILSQMSFKVAVGPLPQKPIYHPVDGTMSGHIPQSTTIKISMSPITPDSRPLIYTPEQVNLIENEQVPISIFGYFIYHDWFRWFWGETKVGFCLTCP